jgi:1,4-alpha-glucan branching enzyme
LLNSDRESYGGSGLGNSEPLQAVPMAYHDHPHSLCLTLPPLGVIFLKPDQRPTTVAAPGPAHEPTDD